MDIYCCRCGEPWDLDSIHEFADCENRTFTQQLREFQRVGCRAMDDTPCNDDGNARGRLRAAAAVAAYDICGEDIDGAASALDAWA